jgi:hypothetical protein
MIMRCWRLLRRWVAIALAISLLFNVLLVGGFLYQRLVVMPRAQAAWSVEALHLNDTQRGDLLKLQGWARDEVKAVFNELAPDIAEVKSGVHDARPGDPRFEEAMRHINDRRLKLQLEASVKLFTFRDSLDPEQRKVFARLSDEHQRFALRILGLLPNEAGL